MGMPNQSRKVMLFENIFTITLVAIGFAAAISKYGFRVAISTFVAISGMIVFACLLGPLCILLVDKDRRIAPAEWRKLLLPSILSIIIIILIFILGISGEFAMILKMSLAFTVVFLVARGRWFA